jgi:hypothetical protein
MTQNRPNENTAIRDRGDRAIAGKLKHRTPTASVGERRASSEYFHKRE